MNKTHIILINYSNWQDTIECLESFKQINNCNFEIILVEVCDLNNSVESLRKYLINYKIKVEFIKLDINNGFAYANNQAIKFIKTQNNAEYIWILNNDTVIKENTLSSLLDFYKQKSEYANVGFVGSKILEYSKPDTIQTVGGTFNPKTGYSKLIGKNEKDQGQYDNVELKPDYIMGASMFFHKSLVDEIGFMPEGYFLYYEDIDWSITALKMGFVNYTCTESVVLHKQGASTANKYGENNTNLSTRKYMYSSYLKFYKKHYKNQLYIAYLILFKQFLGRVLKGQLKEAVIILRVIF